MATRTIDRLIFIFDANSGKWSAFLDSARKALQLEACSLCTITHGLAGEKSEWKECKADLGVPIDYLHKDELSGDLKKLVGGKLPCIVAEAAGERVLLVPRDVLSECKGDVDALNERLHAHAERLGLAFQS